MLELINIKKDYYVDNKPHTALHCINLAFGESGFVSILGPSGCGKTTLLNLIGGLDHYTDGDLLINGKSTKSFKSKDWDAYRNRRIGFVFQSYNLISHLSILQNVQLSLTLAGVGKKEREEKTKKVLQSVGLGNALRKKPNQLSGGQMQRVAIARALINDPDIILADEPTGALDSATSIQVMDILQEVSKTKLVIMVTHNEELARKYSTRIINILDGNIVGDSENIPVVDRKSQQLPKETNKKTHMSFFTALNMSGRNLLTKKGRTILTGISCSFGIIGVALVLAVQNGFTNYIDRVQVQTAASMPITISSYTYSVETIVDDLINREEFPDDPNIRVYEPKSVITTAKRNNISQEYLDYLHSIKDEKDSPISSIIENHDYLDFNILTNRGKTANVMKVDQYASASTTSSLLSSVTACPASVFFELYGDENYINSMYDILDGRFPANKNELVLVTNRYNEINLSTLKTLGILTDADEIPEKMSFEEIYSHTFKAYTNDAFLNTSDPSSYIEKTVDTFEIDEEATKLNMAAKIDAGEKVDSSCLVKKEGTRTIRQYENLDENGYKLKDIYDNNEIEHLDLKIVGVIRIKENSMINLMPNAVAFLPELKDYFFEKQSNSALANDIKNNMYIPRYNDVVKDMTTWTVYKMMFDLLMTEEAVGYPVEIFQELFNRCFAFESIFSNVDNASNLAIFSQQCQKLGVKFNSDKRIISRDFSVDNYQELLEEFATNTVSYVAYFAGYSTVTSVVLFPSSLNGKKDLLKKLDAFNKGKPETDVVQYTDLIGTVTNGLSTMIDIISIVLIVFASISLVVSCVMTGIITYVSVIERTKEIGILRAVGARKNDVGRLFEAESVIVGFIGGVVGILVTLVAQIPINIILNVTFPEEHIGNIANLHPLHAVLLIIISMVLTFISGFIPARIAAKKDPVVALRTE